MADHNAILGSIIAQAFFASQGMVPPTPADLQTALTDAAPAGYANLQGNDKTVAFLVANAAISGKLLLASKAKIDRNNPVDTDEAKVVLETARHVAAMFATFCPETAVAAALLPSEQYYLRKQQDERNPLFAVTKRAFEELLAASKILVASRPPGSALVSLMKAGSGTLEAMDAGALAMAVFAGLDLVTQAMILTATAKNGQFALHLQNFAVAMCVFQEYEVAEKLAELTYCTRPLVHAMDDDAVKYNLGILAAVVLPPDVEGGGPPRPFGRGRTPARGSQARLTTTFSPFRKATSTLTDDVLYYIEGGAPNLPVEGDAAGNYFVDGVGILHRFTELGDQTKFLFEMQCKFQEYVQGVLERFAQVTRAGKAAMRNRRDKVRGGNIDPEADAFIDAPVVEAIKTWARTEGFALVPIGGAQSRYMPLEEAMAHPLPNTVQYEMYRQARQDASRDHFPPHVPAAFQFPQPVEEPRQYPMHFLHFAPTGGTTQDPRSMFAGSQAYHAPQTDHHQLTYQLGAQSQAHQQFAQSPGPDQQAQLSRRAAQSVDALTRRVAELERALAGERAQAQQSAKALAAGPTTSTPVSS